MMKKLIWVSGVLALGGCFGGAQSAYPLYQSENPPSAAETATLSGPIETVDGNRVVKYGSSFALRAGCHDVTNQRTWGGADNNSATMAHLPGLNFAVPMRGGYSYVLEIAGGTEDVGITLTERDAQGKVTQQFEPGRPCAGG